MTETTWEKTAAGLATAPAKPIVRWKFIIGGLLILAAVGYLIVAGTTSGARYYITVQELTNSDKYVGQTVRISGAVLGSTIKYDDQKLIMEFTIADIPAQYEDLGQALHDATLDPKAAHLKVRIENQVKPDLLQNEAQAILTGKLDSKGVFQATEILLKCPSRFNEVDPNKAVATPLGK